MSEAIDLQQWVVETVEETAGEGKSDYWSARSWVKREARQEPAIETERIGGAIDQAVEADELLSWHGLLAVRDRETLLGIVEEERDAEITRKILVGKCNEALQELSEGGESA